MLSTFMTLLLKNFVVLIYLLDSDMPSRGTCVILPQLPLPEMGDGSQMGGNIIVSVGGKLILLPESLLIFVRVLRL